MEIIKAKNAGFCFGVNRAIDEVNRTLLDGTKKIYSIGPLIHNEVVTSDLSKKGLVILNGVDEIKNLKNEIVILRTHGIEKNICELLKENNNTIIDLTCPFVKKIHNLVDEYSNKGYKVIIIGDKEHPEVKGILSYANGEIYVVIDEEDINRLTIEKSSKVLIVFQTTMNVKMAEKLVAILTKLFYNYKIVNTICNATENRQKEVLELAKSCDAMLIIGSETSSNTKKLYEIAKKYCKNSFLLNDKKTLSNIKLKNFERVGVSAGASTPEYLIEEILSNARNEF